VPLPSPALVPSSALTPGGAPANLANLAWPVVGVEVDFAPGGPPSGPSLTTRSINSPALRLGVREIGIDRGRQYELDQVQAGTLTVVVRDPAETLNPDNPASPFLNGGGVITPYRPVWVWAMWPTQPGSGNIINTGVPFLNGVYGTYDPSFETTAGMWASVSFDTTVALSATQHSHGAKSLKVQQAFVGAGDGVNNRFPTIPGLTYTISAYVYPTLGCSVTLQVTDGAGVTRSAVTAVQNTWTRLSVTWNSVDTLEVVTVYSTVVGASTYYVDATQLEFGPSATTFTTTGPVLYPLYTGYIERFPTTYELAGTRAVRPLTAVDALAVLARTEITQSYTAMITEDAPVLRLPYAGTAPPALALTATGGIILPGDQAAGPGGDISWAGDTFPDGTPAVVISQQVQDPVTTPYAAQNTTLDIPHNNTYPINAGGEAPSGVTMEWWARPTNGSMHIALFGCNITGNYVFPFNDASNIFFGLVSAQNGLVFWVQDSGWFYTFPAAPSGTFTADGTNWPDGQWHYYAITLYPEIGDPTVYDVGLQVDQWERYVGTGNPSRIIGANQLTSSVTTAYGEPQSTVSLANIAVYPADIGATARALHYQRGAGYPGELSGARVTRILNTYWQGSSTVAAGYLAMAPDHTYHGRAVLEVLQEIQDSERGLIYVNRAGVPVFEDRSSRYTTDTPIWCLGENPAGASPVEYPYTAYAPDLDPTYVFSQANLSRPGNSDYPPVVNTTTLALYGQRVMSQEVQCQTDFDLDQAGIYYTHRYGSARTRLGTVTLDPAANPALWPVVLGLEISQRHTVARRVSGVTVRGDYYLEHISHRINADAGTWTVDLQLSPVFVPHSWVLGDSTRGVLGSTTVPIY
jgi:hypothetical protein